jgi:hypothetical protein
MSENVGLIEPSFRDAIEIIAASEELPDELKRHWATSLRQFAKATDRPLEVIPARYSAVRNDLANWHHAPSGLTPKTVMNHRSNTKRALLYLSKEKGIPEHGAPLTAEWEQLRAQVSDSLVRYRLSSLIRYCSANNVSPREVDETVVDRFVQYRNRCGKPADDAFRRLLARECEYRQHSRLAEAAVWRAGGQIGGRSRMEGVSERTAKGRRQIPEGSDANPEKPNRAAHQTTPGIDDSGPASRASSGGSDGRENRNTRRKA